MKHIFCFFSFSLIGVFTFAQTQPASTYGSYAVKPSDHQHLSLSGNNLVISNDVEIYGLDQKIIIQCSSYPQSFTPNDLSIVLNTANPVSSDTHTATFDETDIRITGLLTANDIVLFTMQNNDPTSVGGVFADAILSNNISILEKVFFDIEFVEGAVDFTSEVLNPIFYDDFNIYTKDKPIRVVSSNPFTLTTTQNRYYYIDEDSLTEGASEFTVNSNQIQEGFLTNVETRGQYNLFYIPQSGIKTGKLVDVYSLKEPKEKLIERGHDITSNAFEASRNNHLFAHDSHILTVKSSNNNSYILVTYMADKYTPVEFADTETCYLDIYDKTDMFRIATIKIAEPNKNYGNGVTLGDAPVWPRMYQKADGIVRVTFSDKTTQLYYRDLNLNTLSLTLPALMQVTISGGSTINANSSALQTHLENFFGNTDTDYNGLICGFRGTDNVQTLPSGDMYATFEGYPESNPGGGGVPIFGRSEDGGESWIWIGAIFDGDLSDGYPETSLTWLNSQWNVISRGASKYYLTQTTDLTANNLSPVELTDLSPNGALGTRHSIEVIPPRASNQDTVAVIAFNKTKDNVLASRARTNMAFYTTKDFSRFYEDIIFRAAGNAHYPAISLFGSRIYYTFTSSSKKEDSDRDSVYTGWFDISNYFNR